MPQHSRTSRIDAAPLLTGTFTTAQSPTNGIYVGDAYAAEIVINLGTIANAANSPAPTWTFTVMESDSAASGFTAVDASDLVLPDGGAATNGVVKVAAAADQNTVIRAGYLGTKAYVNITATPANTPGNSGISVLVITEKRLVA